MNRKLRDLIRFCNDLRGLLAIHLVLLAMTMIFARGDRGDFWFQTTYFVFVLPGWLLSPRWTGRHSGLVKRYCHALITVFLIHGWLAAIGTTLGLSFHEYFVGFGSVLFLSFVDRLRHLSRRKRDDLAGQRLGISVGNLVLWIAVMSLVVTVYRQPRSNDISQFILQQQDAVMTGQLSPSPIGVSGMGIDRAMPRWNANYWHLWPSLMAVASGLTVQDVLYRFAPIPLALAALVCLIHTVRSLCGIRMPLWAIVLSIFGPVVLWYRAYNAFNYSFRVTNSFCLDKDFCLLFLIPAIVYLAAGWLRGAKHFLPILLLSIPAILRFHPMTAVYLALLTPFVIVGYQKTLVNRRSIALTASALALLATVVAIGDAQSFHRQIQEIIRIDFDDSLVGRPLHYWIGQYASIPELDVVLDTSQWTGDRFHLKLAIIYDSGLFLVAHLAWIVWGVGLIRSTRRVDWQRWLAVGVALATLWLIVVFSPVVLSRSPHLIAGYERLHWFAFVPAIMSCCFGLRTVFDRLADPIRLVLPLLVVVLLIYSAACLAMSRPTGLAHVRGLNSRLDFELADLRSRIEQYEQRLPDGRPALKPAFLRDHDRVLYLGGGGDERYWLIKQSVFWDELYAEAFALHEFGDAFLYDREHFYALVDRVAKAGLWSWLDEKRVSLIVDRREGGDEFLSRLNKEQTLGMEKIESGVWRLSR